MGRTAKPWHWAARGVWCVYLDGRRVVLTSGGPEAEGVAMRALDKMRAARAEASRALGASAPGAKPAAPAYTPKRGPTAGELFAGFLLATDQAVARGERAAVTVGRYRTLLASAADAFGTVPAAELRPHHVNAWLNSRPTWGPTTRHNAATAVRAAIRWAWQEGGLAADPLAGLKKTRPKRREAVPTPADLARVRSAITCPDFRDLFDVLTLTGCRPGEAYAATAAEINLRKGTWRTRNKTRTKTGEEWRTIHLVPEAVAIFRRRAVDHPTGPILTNEDGTAWTRHIVAARLGRIRRRLGMGAELTAYSIRHVYITDALEREVPAPTVAELVGHVDTTMITRVYSKLNKRTDYLASAARRVRPPGGDAGESSG